MKPVEAFVISIVVVLVFFWLKRRGYTEPFENPLVVMPHHSPRDPAYLQTEMNGIPLNVYMSWESYRMPARMKGVIERNIEMNPEFSFFLFSDDDCRTYIKNNFDDDVVKAFDTLVPGAYKSDLWRYCVLYKDGGVYMDIKLETKVPLIQLVKENKAVLVQDRPFSQPPLYLVNGIWNGFMIYPPRNAIFKHCINKIVAACKARDYKRTVLDITGPHLMGEVLETQFSSQAKYKVLRLHESGGKIVKMSDKDEIVLTDYEGYREDQKLFAGKPHYSEYYFNYKVYADT